MKKGTRNLVIFAILTGFLLGYILGVIAFVLPVIEKDFHISVAGGSVLAGAILLGCVIASVYTGLLNDKLGRKLVSYITLIFFIIGVIIFALSSNFHIFYLGRLFQGIGFGMGTIVFPLYIAEVAPTKIRGKLIVTFQLALTTGILFSNVFGLYILKISNWNFMFLSILIIPIIVYFIMYKLPETPRWLYMKGRHEKTREALLKFNDLEDVEIEYLKIIETSKNKNLNMKTIFKVLTNKKSLFAIFIVTLVVSLNQLTGINAFLQCSVSILKGSGLNSNLISMIGGISITGINVVATILTLIFVDKIGRKKILKIGTIGLFITLLLLSLVNFIMPHTLLTGYLTLFGIISLIGFYAFGPGGVILVLCMELLPTNIRGIGISISFTLGALVGVFFVSNFIHISQQIGYSGLFLLIAAFVSCYFWVTKVIPETNGIQLEQIEEKW